MARHSSSSGVWARMRSRLVRPRRDPDARLSVEEVIAMTDRINARVRAQDATRAERRDNPGRHHR